jgi:hypothetical protein
VSASRNKYKAKQAAHIGHAAKNKRLLNASKYWENADKVEPPCNTNISP